MAGQEHIIPCLTVFGVGFGVVMLLEPFILRFALKRGLVDPPDWRKVHTGTVPRIGGVAFFPAILLCFWTIYIVWPQYCQPHYWGLLVALLVISLAGLWDDMRNMRALNEAGMQFVSGAICSGGPGSRPSCALQFQGVELGRSILAHRARRCGVINAINMLNGLDGLAGDARSHVRVPA